MEIIIEDTLTITLKVRITVDTEYQANCNNDAYKALIYKAFRCKLIDFLTDEDTEYRSKTEHITLEVTDLTPYSFGPT